MAIKNKTKHEPNLLGQDNIRLSGPPHALSYEAVSDEIGADTENGLSAAEAQSRLEKYGRNELDDGPGVQPVRILIRQVANAMMLVRSLYPYIKTLILISGKGSGHGHGRQLWRLIIH